MKKSNADKEYVLAFDIGTTRIKAALIGTKTLSIENKLEIPAKVMFPRKGWAEINPNELWENILMLSKKILEEKSDLTNKIKAIIFSPHMAGVVPVDNEGNPLRNIIIWLDERAAGYPKSLWRGIIKIEGYNLFKLIRLLRITGGAPSKTGKDPLSKILWMKDNEPDIYNKTHKFLDVKGYLINKTTGKFITSPDEANLTWLVDTRKRTAKWHNGLIKEYGIEKDKLPEIRESVEIVAKLKEDATRELGIPNDTVVLVGAGDLTTTAVGSGAVTDNDVHIYMGTSDWIGAHLSKRKVDVFHYIGSIFSAIPRKYLLVAEQEIAGRALDWIMEITNLSDYSEIDEKVREITQEEKHPLIFLPWMYGERCPIDDPYVRSSLINIDVKTSKIDLIRSAMEGVTLNIKWAHTFFEKIVGKRDEIRAVGGGCRLESWCQMLADATNKIIKRVKEPENTGLIGAGIIASVGLRVHKSFEEASKLVKIDKVFKPNKERVEYYNKMIKEFEKAYKKLKKIYRKLNVA